MRLLTIILTVIYFSLMVTTTMAQDCSTQSAEDWLTQADNDFDIENYDAAIAGYSCVITLGASDDNLAEAYEWRGITYDILGDNDAALADLNIAVTYSGNPGSYYSRANLYLGMEQYEQAIADYDEALANGYIYAAVYNNRGVAYDRNGDKENARRSYEQAIQVADDYGLAYTNLAEMNFYLGDMESALQNTQMGLDNSSGVYLSFAHERSGLLSYVQGDYIASSRDFTTALEFDTDNTDAMLYRANTYRAMNSPNENADYLRYVQALQPEVVDLDSDILQFVDEPLEMQSGTIYRVSFFLSSGRFFSASANATEESTVDPMLVLLGPSGSAISGDDNSGTNRDAVIDRFPIAQEGIYTLLVTHGIYDDSGTMTLSTRVRDDMYQDIIPTRLTIGDRAKIFSISNDGSGVVNLREYPSTGFTVLDRLQSGTEVTLLAGPYADEDYIWWNIETDDGISGWMVESLGDVQILSPAIEVGHNVIINAPELNFRAEPTASGELVVSLYREVQVILPVLDGPVVADNLTWWQVRLNDGREAWAVERVGNNQTLTVLVDN